MLTLLNTFRPTFPTLYDHFVNLSSDLTKVDDDNLVLSVDLPGYEKSEIKVYSESGYVVVSAKNDTRRYYRSWELPENEKVGKIKYNNGVLQIEIQRIISEKDKRVDYSIE